MRKFLNLKIEIKNYKVLRKDQYVWLRFTVRKDANLIGVLQLCTGVDVSKTLKIRMFRFRMSQKSPCFDPSFS